MSFKSKKHKRSFERNMAKGFFTGLRTRCNQLASCQSLYDSEKKILIGIKRDVDFLLTHWNKFPPEEEKK